MSKSTKNINLLNFIKAIAEKKYAQADKYLTEEINARLMKRIKQNLK